MAQWAQHWRFALRSLAGTAILAVVGLAGCSKHDETDAPRAGVEPPAEPEKEQSTPAVAVVKKPVDPSAFGNDDPQHQPFAQAAFTDDAPPPDANRPPDATITGKPTFALLKQVRALWETIRFTTLDGKAIEYTAVVETDRGDFEIALRPDVAPNHVRSFVALATAGFYDGLLFDHIRVEADKADSRLEQIEAGNPRGAEEINGTIGYWLPLEPSDKLDARGGHRWCLSRRRRGERRLPFLHHPDESRLSRRQLHGFRKSADGTGRGS